MTKYLKRKLGLLEQFIELFPDYLNIEGVTITQERDEKTSRVKGTFTAQYFAGRYVTWLDNKGKLQSDFEFTKVPQLSSSEFRYIHSRMIARHWPIVVLQKFLVGYYAAATWVIDDYYPRWYRYLETGYLDNQGKPLTIEQLLLPLVTSGRVLPANYERLRRDATSNRDINLIWNQCTVAELTGKENEDDEDDEEGYIDESYIYLAAESGNKEIFAHALSNNGDNYSISLTVRYGYVDIIDIALDINDENEKAIQSQLSYEIAAEMGYVHVLAYLDKHFQYIEYDQVLLNKLHPDALIYLVQHRSDIIEERFTDGLDPDNYDLNNMSYTDMRKLVWQSKGALAEFQDIKREVTTYFNNIKVLLTEYLIPDITNNIIKYL